MRLGLFLLLSVILAFLMVVLPFFLFTETPRFSGAFLFWTIIPAATVVFRVIYTRKWGQGGSE